MTWTLIVIVLWLWHKHRAEVSDFMLFVILLALLVDSVSLYGKLFGGSP